MSTLKYGGARSFLFGEGSYRYGGRWNSPGSFRAVYGSVDAVTALKESEANAAYANLPYPFRERDSSWLWKCRLRVFSILLRRRF